MRSGGDKWHFHALKVNMDMTHICVIFV